MTEKLNGLALESTSTGPEPQGFQIHYLQDIIPVNCANCADTTQTIARFLRQFHCLQNKTILSAHTTQIRMITQRVKRRQPVKSVT